MRVDWTGSGGCTNGSTAPPRGATRRVSGGAATTSTGSVEPDRGCRWRNRGTGDLATQGFRASFPASLLRRLGAALRRQRGGDDRLVRVHVGDGRDANARRRDDVDGMDADARTVVARYSCVVPWDVDRDDGGDDAAVPGSNAVALPRSRWHEGRDTPRQADRARGRGLLLSLGRSAGPLVFQRRSFTIPNIQISRSRFARYARRTRTRNWTSQLTPTRVTRPKMLRSFGSKNGFGVLSTKYALCRKRTNFCMAS